ncbi:alkaline phosphatase family protein [Nocardioides sp. CFH 31398]|uniref:alkaline phosphatase family protein n=1 Tax=Nocardioides sp. CFH 31398 TaxID=2919579 RepID=UPI001F056082|nr:alkaline phosphatase family protein [Nocardioides sp. CFH 31398]MCH1867586.1 alkaline phosphatase family protein [Nocardioides sp. CFH 31398]
MSAPGASRRTVLQAGAGVVLSTAAMSAPAAAQVAARRGSRRRRAYVVVLDGCRPAEIDGELGGDLMPTVRRLRSAGRTFPRARSLPVMETIPNHTMMMTGVRPDRSGVPANAVYDRELGETRTLDRPGDMRADTVLQRCRRQGLTSGTVLSKEYLFGIFGTRATHRWEPEPLVPVSEHAPDVFTMDATLAMIDAHDPDLVFVNLGDIDRVGHSDLTGTSLQVARRAALASADTQVSRLVTALEDSGRWRDSLLVVLADHSMDWSRPDRSVSLSPVLAEDPFLADRVVVGQNGGADLVYWTGPARDREQAVRRIRRLALATDGVLAAHDRRRAASWLRLGPEAGDVVVYSKAGWRFSDPSPGSNPLPGNHGHPTTSPIPFFLSGGHPDVGRGSSSALATTVDVAPTVARFLGLRGAPRGGWDGVPRL